MKKSVLIVFIFGFFTSNLFSQKVSLIKPLSADDIEFLKTEARECVDYTVHFSLNYSAQFSGKFVQRPHEQPSSLEKINDLKKELKGDINDASVFVNISGVYKRLQMQNEANQSVQKAYDLLLPYVKEHPDNISALMILAGTYSGDVKEVQTDKAIDIYKNILKIDSNFIPAAISLYNTLAFSRRTEEAYKFLILNRVFLSKINGQ